MLKSAILSLLLILPSICIEGVELSDLTTTATLYCMKEAHRYFAIARAYLPDGTIDPNLKSNLNNARAAGLFTDIYLSPCKVLNPEA